MKRLMWEWDDDLSLEHLSETIKILKNSEGRQDWILGGKMFFLGEMKILKKKMFLK